MRKLLLLTGDLATGKSTFAGMLSKRYQVPVYYKDTIKEVLGDTIGYTNREENLKLSHATVALMTFLFEEATKLGQNMILEANFHTHELERLHEIAVRNGYQVLTLVFRADNEILHQRYLNRIHNENRHPVHIINALDRFEDFVAYIEKARAEEVPGATIPVQADDFTYQKCIPLLAELDDFMVSTEGHENV